MICVLYQTATVFNIRIRCRTKLRNISEIILKNSSNLKEF